MKIYLVRHGQTAWTLEKRIQGQLDIPLNEEGVRQALIAADFFENKTLSAVHSSNLSRAMQTAKLVSGCRYDVNCHPDLNERNFGAWQEQLWSTIKEKQSQDYALWEKGDLNFRPPQGESLLELYTRSTKKFINILSRYDDDDSILVVAHGGPLKAILTYVAGEDPSNTTSRVHIDCCSIIKLNYDFGKITLGDSNN